MKVKTFVAGSVDGIRGAFEALDAMVLGYLGENKVIHSVTDIVHHEWGSPSDFEVSRCVVYSDNTDNVIPPSILDPKGPCP